jgi:hypothetical protein
VDDEPKHPAHFAKKSAPLLPDPSDDDYGIGLDLLTGFEVAISFGHAEGKLP